MARWFLLPLCLVTLVFAFAQPSQALHISTRSLMVPGPTSLETGADLVAVFGRDNIGMAMGSIDMAYDGVYWLTPTTVPGTNMAKGNWVKVKLEEGEIATLNLSGNRAALLINPPDGNISYARVSGLESVTFWKKGHGNGTTSPIPEPMSAVLFGAGLLIVGAALRRSA